MFLSDGLSAQSLLQDDGREVQLPPQERVAAVRPFWETLTQEDRVELLSITVEDLRARSKEVVARLRRQAGTQRSLAWLHKPCWNARLDPILASVMRCAWHGLLLDASTMSA